MIIKYRMLPAITLQQFKDDIAGLIAGTITTVNDLSAGCDKANSSMTGTYPAGIYTRVNGTSYTFSKVHGTDASYTHYFRLNFGASSWTTTSLAQSYISGTDTLVNSVAYTTPIFTYSYSAFNGGLTIVLTSKCIHFTSTYNNRSFGIFDLGNNGITTTYANNMKMAFVNTLDGSFGIPYAYVLGGSSSSGYGSITGTISSSTQPIVAVNAANAGILPENPVFASSVSQGHSAYGIFNLFRIPGSLPDKQYNTSGVTRQTAAGYAIVTE